MTDSRRSVLTASLQLSTQSCTAFHRGLSSVTLFLLYTDDVASTAQRQIFAAEFMKNAGETITWKAERVGVPTMTKKVTILEEDDYKRSTLFDLC